MHPEDPTRIPAVVERLRTAWEAQPSVPFAQLWAQLESVGVGFNATDTELVEACDELLRRVTLILSPRSRRGRFLACLVTPLRPLLSRALWWWRRPTRGRW